MLSRKDPRPFWGPYSTVLGNEGGKFDARARRMQWEGSWTPKIANLGSKTPKMS